jgi:hypothetical protein
VAASRVREGGRTFPDSHTDGPPGSIVALSRPPPLGAILILLPVHCQSPSTSLIFEASLALVGGASTPRSTRCSRRRRRRGGWGGRWGGRRGGRWGCRDGDLAIDGSRGLCALDPCRRLLVIYQSLAQNGQQHGYGERGHRRSQQHQRGERGRQDEERPARDLRVAQGEVHGEGARRHAREQHPPREVVHGHPFTLARRISKVLWTPGSPGRP